MNTERNEIVPATVVARILEEINAENEIFDAELVGIANELAAGVTAEREAELAEALPGAYVSSVNARAQDDGDKIRVPKAVYTHATYNQGAWLKTMSGGKLRRVKMDVVVGAAVEFEMPEADLKIVRLVILWRRKK